MNDNPIELIEQQLAAVGLRGAPAELRGAVLADVRRELRAARWDRRLVRAAAVLLAMGIALNAGIGLLPVGAQGETHVRMVRDESQRSLVDAAVLIAEASDAATGRRFAQQLAAMRGRVLTADEAAAIDAAVGRVGSNEPADGNKG